MKKYRKKRVKKYNKFFSYKNVDRAKRNFSYKDFGYSRSYNTKFTGSLFYGNYFNKACMKYCGFNGCKFRFIEFKNTNFRGSRFKGAVFENVLFDNCNLENADFHGAEFRNVYYSNTSLKKTRGISSPETLKRLSKYSAKVDLGENLVKAILHCKKNKYILESDTLFYKEKDCLSNAKKRELKELPRAERKRLQRQRQIEATEKSWMINRVNIIRLLDVYSEDEIANGLHLAADSIDKSFNSLSYFLPYIRKAQENIEGGNKNEG